jgi:Domain of unknown function (DUF4124)
MNKTLFLLHICLIFTGILLSSSINAEMYKWVDEDGNTHYSQSAPVDNTSVEIIKPPGNVDTKSAAKTVDNQKKSADKIRNDRIAAKEKAQKTKEAESLKKENCQKAKARLASYQRPRVQKQNEDGSRSFVAEEDRQAEIKKSQAYVDEACN